MKRTIFSLKLELYLQLCYFYLFKPVSPLLPMISRSLYCAVAAVFFSVVGYGEETKDTSPSQKGEKDKKKLTPEEIIAAWDADQDGKLTEEEFAKSKRARHLSPARQSRIFSQLDRDQNDALTLDELNRAYGKVFQKGERWVSPQLIDELDTNQDGVITRKEFDSGKRFSGILLRRRAKIFNRLDKNVDGVLTTADRVERNKEAGIYFNQLDSNQNGFLSLDEFMKSEQARKLLRDRYRSLDEDQDGRLSEYELYRKDDGKSSRKNSKKKKAAEKEAPKE